MPDVFLDNYCSCGNVKHPNPHLCPHCDAGTPCPPGCLRCHQYDSLCRVCWTSYLNPDRARACAKGDLKEDPHR